MLCHPTEDGGVDVVSWDKARQWVSYCCDHSEFVSLWFQWLKGNDLLVVYHESIQPLNSSNLAPPGHHSRCMTFETAFLYMHTVLLSVCSHLTSHHHESSHSFMTSSLFVTFSIPESTLKVFKGYLSVRRKGSVLKAKSLVNKTH